LHASEIVHDENFGPNDGRARWISHDSADGSGGGLRVG
jgi:hypothetical protein